MWEGGGHFDGYPLLCLLLTYRQFCQTQNIDFSLFLNKYIFLLLRMNEFCNTAQVRIMYLRIGTDKLN